MLAGDVSGCLRQWKKHPSWMSFVRTSTVAVEEYILTSAGVGLHDLSLTNMMNTGRERC